MSIVNGNFSPVFMVCHSVKWIPNTWEWVQMGTGRSNKFWPSYIGKFRKQKNPSHL